MLTKTVQNVVESLLGQQGATDPILRRTIFDRARGAAVEVPAFQAVAPELGYWVEKIFSEPWMVTDQDFICLREAGYSEDQIFELTVAAAMGAGVRRLEAGLKALAAADPEKMHSQDGRNTISANERRDK